MISAAAQSKRSGARADKAKPATPPKAQPAPSAGLAALRRGRRRVLFIAAAFLIAMTVVATRFGDLALQGGDIPVATAPSGAGGGRNAERADILDRNGMVLAKDIQTYELYLDTSKLHFDWQRSEAIESILGLFPDLDPARLTQLIEGGGTPPIKWPITPAMAQAAHELGIPGLYASPRLDRLYPGRETTSHLLGATNLEGVGRAGVEMGLEPRLSADDAEPLTLSIDFRVQQATRDILLDGMRRTTARAAAAVVMDVDSGETLALVSLPDFDPHAPPPSAGDGPAEESPAFSRAVRGGYELGSIYKVFTWALAIENDASDIRRTFEPPTPFKVGPHTIKDDYPIRTSVTFADAFAKSSNIVAARLALKAGRESQQRLFQALGFNEDTGLETIEARGQSMRFTPPWTQATTATAAFGHGVSASPLHVAAATAAIVNGGVRVRPTLLKRSGEDGLRRDEPVQAISPGTSRIMRDLLEHVVLDGTGRRAAAPGYRVGGKTGTANKINPLGGYYDDRVLATFVGAFPIDTPRYVVLVMLDEPTDMSTGEPNRGAGVTAAPIVGRLVPRIAPLLGVAPRFASTIETSSTD